MTKRSSECEKALIDMAKKVAVDINERYRNAANELSATESIQEMQVTMHHGNSLGKTYYCPSKGTPNTLVEVQPDLAIRTTGGATYRLKTSCLT